MDRQPQGDANVGVRPVVSAIGVITSLGSDAIAGTVCALNPGEERVPARRPREASGAGS